MLQTEAVWRALGRGLREEGLGQPGKATVTGDWPSSSVWLLSFHAALV